MQPLVLFGSNSNFAIELQESCWRLKKDFLLFDNLNFSNTSTKEVNKCNLREAVENSAILALGYPKRKLDAHRHAIELGFANWESLIDPKSVVSKTMKMQDGCYINAGAVVGGMVNLGEHVTINKNATIGHHAHIGSFSYISIGALVSGNVKIGSNVLIGGGAFIREGVTIGDNSVIGGGTTILEDVEDNLIVTEYKSLRVREQK